MSSNDQLHQPGKAMDHDTEQCSVCEQPILPGEARNGIYRSHWDCPLPSTSPELKPSVKKRVRTTKSPTAPNPDGLKRFDWIEDWLRTKQSGTEVDVLDLDFVVAYIDAHNAGFLPKHIGAPKCPQLGRDLSWMCRLDRLSRVATGLSPGDASMGFPRWVYTYSLKV